mgnify:CR=1 FL=1
MSLRISRITTAVACAATLSLAALVAPAAAGAAAAAPGTRTASIHCNATPDFVSSGNGNFTGNGINIHSGPHVGCGVYGDGYQEDQLKVWCFYYSGRTKWVYLNDRSTGLRGWSEARYVVYDVTHVGACTI